MIGRLNHVAIAVPDLAAAAALYRDALGALVSAPQALPAHGVGVVVYILVWWVTLFAILPLWVTPSEPDELGHAAGAPRRPLLGRKLLLTSLVAAAIWLGIHFLVRSPWLSFRDS